MEFTTKIIAWIIFTLSTVIFIYMIYYNLMSLRGYFAAPNIIPCSKPRNKFLVLLPSVNEESVINIPIDDLMKQSYPKSLYNVYVIADHCTDNTAQVAEDHGAKVITTAMNPDFKRHGIGKSNTLDYGLHQVPNWEKYDYMIVIDSDNNVSSNFFATYE